MKIADHLVQEALEEDRDKAILHRPTTPVNMRLYKCNTEYRKIILSIIRYMDEHLNTKFEDYPEIRGVAAPSLGFPFRLIGFKKQKNESQFCINPRITSYSATMIGVHTNDGSLRLKESVSFDRSSSIDLEYYDLEGNIVEKKNILRIDGGFTIQNAVDQCDGITVVDRANMKKPQGM